MGQKLFYNGTILTMEEELYAEAVRVEDGNVTGVGSYEMLLDRVAADVEKVDLGGRTLMPAFIDPHRGSGELWGNRREDPGFY